MDNNLKIQRVMQEMLATVSDDENEKNLGMKGFERLYLFTNEHLEVYVKRLNVKNKRVLTVGSSGDQILYSLLNGAREVVCVDLCPIVKNYFALKVACIKNLSFEEFSTLIDAGDGIFSPEVYRKVSHDIFGESREFWDHLFLEGFTNSEYKINRVNLRLEDERMYLNNEQVYNEMQQKLKSLKPIPVMFLTGDIRRLPYNLHGDNKFDVIMLSNIAHYARSWNRERSKEQGTIDFIKLVKELTPFVTEKGVMQIDYAYRNRMGLYDKYCRLLGKDKISSSKVTVSVGPILYRPHTNNDKGEEFGNEHGNE